MAMCGVLLGEAAMCCQSADDGEERTQLCKDGTCGSYRCSKCSQLKKSSPIRKTSFSLKATGHDKPSLCRECQKPCLKIGKPFVVLENIQIHRACLLRDTEQLIIELKEKMTEKDLSEKVLLGESVSDKIAFIRSEEASASDRVDRMSTRISTLSNVLGKTKNKIEDLEKLMKPLIEQKKRGYCFSVKQQSEWDDFSCQLAAITSEYERVEAARQNEMNDWIKFSKKQMSLAQRIDESQKSRMRTYYYKQK